MKKYLYLIAILIFTPCQNALAGNTNVILHLNDKSKLPQLEKNVANLRKSMGDDLGIRVIINGKAITAMLSGNKLIEDKVNSMLTNNAKIGLCHTSMHNNNIDRKHIIKGVSVLPEGALQTIINLQNEGYLYIKI